jgi:hypothetical protein
MTFTLVSVVYAAVVAKPGHGNCAPLAIGFTLFASAFVGARKPCQYHSRVKVTMSVWHGNQGSGSASVEVPTALAACDHHDLL